MKLVALSPFNHRCIPLHRNRRLSVQPFRHPFARLRCIARCIGLNQKNHPILHLVSARRYALSGLYLCIRKSQRYKHFWIYQVWRYETIVSVATLSVWQVHRETVGIPTHVIHYLLLSQKKEMLNFHQMNNYIRQSCYLPGLAGFPK